MIPTFQNGNSFYNCSQIGFIDFLVTPLYDAWCSFSKTEYTQLCMQNISNNRNQWQIHSENQNILEGVAPHEFEKLDQLLDLNIPLISFGGRHVERKTILPRRFTYGPAQTHETDLKKIVEQLEESQRIDSKNTSQIRAI